MQRPTTLLIAAMLTAVRPTRDGPAGRGRDPGPGGGRRGRRAARHHRGAPEPGNRDVSPGRLHRGRDLFPERSDARRLRALRRAGGVQEVLAPGIRLQVGKTATVDIGLEIGGPDEQITVSGEAPIVDVTSKEVGGHITSGELTDLPSLNRSFIGFVALLPGVVPITGAGVRSPRTPSSPTGRTPATTTSCSTAPTTTTTSPGSGRGRRRGSRSRPCRSSRS